MHRVPVAFPLGDEGRNGGALQAADDRFGQHFAGNFFGGSPAHVGKHRGVLRGAQVGDDEFQQLAGGFQGGGASLQGAAVGNQAGLRGENAPVFQRPQAVVAQGGAGGNQINDEVGVADGGGDFQRTFGGNQADVGHAVAGEKLAALVGELGRYPQGAAKPRLPGG